MSTPRFVLVENTDNDIRYIGPWFNNTLNYPGVFGPPFQDTIPGVNVNGTILGTNVNNTLKGARSPVSFSYSFSGWAVGVYALYTDSTTEAPISGWDAECILDLNNSLTLTFTSSSSSGWGFCYGQFPDGNHTLTVNANVQGPQLFWFAKIEYALSSNVSLDQPFEFTIDSTDPAITYSLGWQNQTTIFPQFFGNTRYTAVNGEWLTLIFFGTLIAGFGTLSNPLATYSVDDQPATLFPEVNSSSGLINSTGMLFEVGNLSPEQHQLSIEYIGYDNTTLYISYFVVQNASSPSPLPSSSTTIRRKPIIGVIGVILISLLLNVWQVTCCVEL